MQLSRNLTHFFRFALDELLPPVLRDSKWFMWPFFYFVFKNKTHYFMEFKKRAPELTKQEFSEVYKNTHDVHINRDTDINKECLQKIRNDIVGNNLLDAGCGNGYLTRLLENDIEVTGCDINKYPEYYSDNNKTCFVKTNIEAMDFEDNCFDTVVCAHTLEHVVDFESAIKELYRITKSRLIIIIPMQREYKYTFDLHLQFFPNTSSFLIRCPKIEYLKRSIEVVKGDIYFKLDFQK